MSTQRRRRFSMIRDFTAADFLTIGNGACGFISVLAVCRYLLERNADDLWLAIWILPVAATLDYFDGRVARWRQEASLLGAQLDSLADLISFGVAPAVLAYGIGMRTQLDALALVYFVLCGLSRLARYNATADAMSDESGKVKYFEGTPIPTSLVLVLGVGALLGSQQIEDALPFGLWAVGPLSMHPLVLCYVASGSAMISKMRVPKP
ncbi:MAG: CDP-alcohol phosphatidyltransferase family protein [Myxococcales bacterium]|nr:CDP-alcohol phosphatidyltransferase family protein [Myxococcales bacterium]MDD9970754.1 CDP-alcohol phosphatidyltransferase family protein [Myxococcales bacterium]